MDLSPQDIRDVRFGTTRVRAGYDMAEVDAFLDTIEAAISSYSSQSQQLRDEAEALRSQIQQMQARSTAMQAELEECRMLQSASADDGHDTIVTEIEISADTETTAENPIVGGNADESLSALRQVRDDVQRMLVEQLRLVEGLDLEPR